MKQCRLCSQTKPLSEFYLKSDKSGPRSQCKTCWLEKSRSYYKSNRDKAYATKRRWSANNPEKVKLLLRAGHLKHKFGITLEEYDRVLQSQGGVCKICRQVSVDRSLDIDHNHNTGQVRGLLCGPCNRGLSSFKDSTLYLQSATEYLSPKEKCSKSPLGLHQWILIEDYPREASYEECLFCGKQRVA